MALDISDRTRLEASVRDREERYRLMARATNDVIWDWGFETGEVVWNDAVHEVFRYAREEVVGRVEWWSARIHPDDRARVLASQHARCCVSSSAPWAETRWLKPTRVAMRWCCSNEIRRAT